MAVYAFKCASCGNTEQPVRAVGDSRPPVCHCGTTMIRDYKTEWGSQSVHIPMHMRSANTTSRSDFLPGTKDFESPSDPTGEKGMKEWKDTHKVKGSTWV